MGDNDRRVHGRCRPDRALFIAILGLTADLAQVDSLPRTHLPTVALVLAVGQIAAASCGLGRLLVMDRNRAVVSPSVAAGSTVPLTTSITLPSRKIGE